MKKSKQPIDSIIERWVAEHKKRCEFYVACPEYQQIEKQMEEEYPRRKQMVERRGWVATVVTLCWGVICFNPQFSDENGLISWFVLPLLVWGSWIAWYVGRYRNSKWYDTKSKRLEELYLKSKAK